MGYVFRKNGSDLKKGGAFEEAVKIFKAVYGDDAIVTQQPMCIRVKDGGSLSFTGLDGNEGMQAIHGIQISAAMVDEATHLSEQEIWWIITRLRTTAKMKPHIWLTCNPDPDCFFFPWIQSYHPLRTYVNDNLVEGRVNPKENGKVRYIKAGDEMKWADSEEQLIAENPEYFYERNFFRTIF